MAGAEGRSGASMRAQARSLAKLAEACHIESDYPTDEEGIYRYLMTQPASDEGAADAYATVDELVRYYAREGQEPPGWLVRRYDEIHGWT